MSYWLARPVVVGTLFLAGLGIFGAVAWACSGSAIEPTGTETHFPLVYGDRPTVAQLSDLGRRMFFDTGLSASGRQSCATCHDPRRAFGPPNAKVVQAGGPEVDRFGFRNTPSLRYLHSPIAFTEHFFETEVSGGKDDQGPTGGRTWDGRVNTGHDQALMPLLDANEMANRSPEELAERLRKSPYASEFRDAVSAPGENVFDDPAGVVIWLSVALETYEQSPQDFHPFSSKYDAYLRDQANLSPSESRGLRLFNDMKKGNCASCHPSNHKNPSQRSPLFTDFGFVALAVPRNRGLPANRDKSFQDLGLCGPVRTDLLDRPEYCGLFRTPTLRNVALRHHFFHNGAIHSLHEAVEFYATRDVQPERWYGRGTDGKPLRYEDLSKAYWDHVNVEPPFKPLPNGRPRLSAYEIDDIVAFLKTLTDGFVPHGAAARTAGGGPPSLP